jgi:hypothetical protein
MALGVDSASNRNDNQESSWGKGWPALTAENLTAICDLENVEASTSHNPIGLHGLLEVQL